MDNEYNRINFSIILPFYNSENLISKAIDSIISQSLDFEKNVELILINDGSTDDSENIVLEYKKLYPDNIVLLNQDNKGQASAKNLGLEYVSGTYVGFLDSDDYLSENALEEVLNFFNNNPVNIVAIPITYFERCNNQHKFNNKFEKEGIIYLSQAPEKFLLSCCSTFIKSNIIKDIKFNEKLKFSDSFHFILKVLSRSRYYGVLSSARYYYRKRLDLTSVSDDKFYDKCYLLDRFENFYMDIINDYGLFKLPKYIQFAFVYDLHTFILNYNQNILSDDELNSVYDYLELIFKNIDNEVILNTKNINFMIKSYLYFLKNKNYSFVKKDSKIKLNINDFELDYLNDHKLWINDVNIVNNYLSFSGFFYSYFDNDYVSIHALKYSSDTNEIINPFNEYKKVNKLFLNDNWHFKYEFTFKIPLDDFYKHNIKLFLRLYDYKIEIESSNSFTDVFLGIDFKNKSILKSNKFFKNNWQFSFNENSFDLTYVFDFSIIIAVYNTEDYLGEAVDSIINQSLNFNDHVQLILVDDGSEDNSLNIALEYQNKYPKNILVFSQENKGQASARNLGLKYSLGIFVNFLDSDDYLSKNALEEVLNFFNNNSDINVVSIPMFYFGRRENPHILNGKFYETRIISLDDEPNSPLLSCSSSFFRKDSLEGNNFNIHLENLEDALLINQILLKDKKYGVISSSKYYYRKRYDSTSTTDTKALKSENFIDRLKMFHINLINSSKIKYGKVEKFLQYLFIYDFQWMIDLPSLQLDDFGNEKFWYYFNFVMNHIDQNVILNNNYLENNKKLFLFNLKVDDLHIEYKNNNVLLMSRNKLIDNLKEHWFWLDIVEIDNGFINISGFLNSHFNSEEISVDAVKKYNSGDVEYFPAKLVQYSSRKNICYLSKIWGFKYNFDIKIPLHDLDLCDINLKVNYHKDKDSNNFSKENIVSFYLTLGFLKHCRISRFSNYSIYGSKVIFLDENTFKILKYSRKLLINLELRVAKRFMNKFKSSKNKIFINWYLLRVIYIIAILFNLKRKPIYLFMDRIDDADDNGKYLFKYASSIDDNVKKYFVLSEESKDFKDMVKIGKILKYNSFKHLLMYLLADKVISSHPDQYLLDPFYHLDDGTLFNGLITSKLYFLQHGVTLGNVSSWLSKCEKNLKLLVAVSEDERKSFFVNGYNYDEDVVQVLGFPRFDNLNNDSVKKQILLMPTWRKGIETNKETFINSRYYFRLSNLLNNDHLIELCKKNNCDIIFKPHPRLNNYIGETDEKFIDLIEINKYIKLSDDSYQKLFNESSLLITDYSSVAFDFAYLKKPLIYFQPDDDYHHGKSYFDFETMGFGCIIKNEEELVEKIGHYISKEFIMETNFKERVNKFYKFIDKNNCKRVYEWIKEN